MIEVAIASTLMVGVLTMIGMVAWRIQAVRRAQLAHLRAVDRRPR